MTKFPTKEKLMELRKAADKSNVDSWCISLVQEYNEIGACASLRMRFRKFGDDKFSHIDTAREDSRFAYLASPENVLKMLDLIDFQAKQIETMGNIVELMPNSYKNITEQNYEDRRAELRKLVSQSLQSQIEAGFEPLKRIEEMEKKC